MKEAGRYYTVSAMSLPRKAAQDIEWDGAIIPKSTMVLINAQAGNHEEEHFGPDAKIFNPERWLQSLSPPEERPSTGLQHLSFGAGSRACSGQQIASRLLYTALVRLLSSFKIVASEDEPPNTDYVVSNQRLYIAIRLPRTAAKRFQDYNQFKSALVAIPRDFKVKLIPRDPEKLAACLKLAEERTKDAYA